MKERKRVENLDIDGRILLKWILKNTIGGVDWINLAQDRDKRLAAMGAVMNFRILQNAGNFFTS